MPKINKLNLVQVLNMVVKFNLITQWNDINLELKVTSSNQN